MGKRARSEDDENSGQGLMKMHVSEKEVNMGILQEKRMQNVYNKTMSKLFKGTKNLANNNAHTETCDNIESLNSHDTVSYKQLSITASCGISKESVIPVLSKCCSCTRTDCATSGVLKCASCNGNVGSRCVKSCESCRTISCSICDSIRPCQGCGTLFCSLCAMPSSFRDDLCLCYNCEM